MTIFTSAEANFSLYCWWGVLCSAYLLVRSIKRSSLYHPGNAGYAWNCSSRYFQGQWCKVALGSPWNYGKRGDEYHFRYFGLFLFIFHLNQIVLCMRAMLSLHLVVIMQIASPSSQMAKEVDLISCKTVTLMHYPNLMQNWCGLFHTAISLAFTHIVIQMPGLHQLPKQFLCSKKHWLNF